MHTLYDVPAPAKLNLFLHITGRRADGYHLLQSVFMLLDWCDTLSFERLAHSATITRSDAQTHPGTCAPLPTHDLCVRAAQALQAATGCQQGVHIHLHKSIPAQAGMGGGSSDAASTLLALNRLWRLGLTRAQLARIGLSLGADVPFFIHGRNAWVEGVGDAITPLEGAGALPSARFVVIKPAAGLETAQIFSSPKLKRDTKRATISGFAADHYGFGHNDLQPVACALCPEIEQSLSFLEGQNFQAKMTGSGSAVFAKTQRSVDIHQAPSSWLVRTCENLQKHPLFEWVQD